MRSKTKKSFFLMFSIHPLFVLFPTLIRTLQNTYYKKRTPLLYWIPFCGVEFSDFNREFYF